ncbi:Ribosomal protein S6 [Methanosarcina siciliae C2J]|uniref:Ribosomal protein S6 n=2 Tax=Methanosarcina siciliae TaxID=38027 RepID=A0A0E3P8D7_9EURY|nr:Ribosomal protein S6 [Methanosarcina siciliae T4/M]AKB38501.1 Ribosomal protein S6 [Methanosarcina siciliae C2J]
MVTSRDEILSLEHEEKAVHLAFRPSDRDLFSLVKTCPGIEILQLPASSYEGLSKFIKMFLGSSGIHLVKGDVSGHWHDLNNYFVIPSYVLEKIKELEVQGRTEEEIIEEITSLRKISPDMVLHLLHSSFLTTCPERPGINNINRF